MHLVAALVQAVLPTVAGAAPLRRGPMIDVASVSKYVTDEREHLIDPWIGLLCLGGAVAVVAALAGWRWWQRRAERSRPGWLLGQVRHAAGLTAADARLLRQIAHTQGLPHAAALTLSRQTFDLHATAFLTEHARSADRLRPRLAHLAQRLYDPPAPAPPLDPVAT
jgi:hypothetical protein